MLKKITAAAAATLLATSGAYAQTASLSVANADVARAGAEVSEGNELRGAGTGVYLIGAVVLGLIIWGIIELVDDDPSSP